MLHLKEYLSHVKPGIALDVGTRFGEFAFTLVEAMPEGSRVIGIDCDAAIWILPAAPWHGPPSRTPGTTSRTMTPCWMSWCGCCVPAAPC